MTTRDKATGKSERLAVLNNAEQEALYGLPDFDDAQRLEFLALDESELTLACSRQGLHAQIYCILQIAYFKAKHLFFRFGWDDVKDDCNFVLSRYFHEESLPDKLPSKYERYAQRNKICALYDYQPWSSALASQLQLQAAHIVHRDVTPGFVATELIIWLNEHKIIRPGYTTLQELVSQALSRERQRLGRILLEQLDDATISGLDKLIERDDTLSRLAILRQDARDFGWRQMVHEREKRAILEPLQRKACDLLPALNISQQNMLYYASLVNFYTVYDLRNLKPEQPHLYLLCYAWIRYRQFSDNLVDAMFFHMKQLEDESRSGAEQLMADVQEKHRRETSKIGRLLSLYVDDSVPDPTTFGEVRRRAWKIMPRETLKTTAQRMSVKPISRLALHTLGLKEMTQGTLMRKLCTYTTANPTRQAIFEYDRLVRSIYTLKYLRDPQLERNIRRSQNRIESYHQLRAAVSKVGGKKELSGKNDLETEISNQCGRLICNAIVYYNSAILSRLQERLEAEGNAKGIEVLTRISPVAWQHILLNGHYTFHSSNEIMDLNALVAGLKLG